MEDMLCEVVRRIDPGCHDCVVESTTGSFHFRPNAEGTANTKTTAPERELFYVERLLFPVVQLGGSFANDVQGRESVAMSRSGGRRSGSGLSPGGVTLCSKVYPGFGSSRR